MNKGFRYPAVWINIEKERNMEKESYFFQDLCEFVIGPTSYTAIKDIFSLFVCSFCSLCLGLKKIIVGFRLPTHPCRLLQLINFYACQKYKIKYCRPSVVERLGFSKSICNLLTRKCVYLSAAANSAIVMCCLFVWDS